MSLHSLDLECIGRGPDQHRKVFWQAHCACGWNGHEHPTASSTGDIAGKAKREYRDHVEDALGAEAYYTAPVGCANCAFDGDANVLVGTDVWSATCPRCGARGRLRPNNEFREERVRW